MTLARKIKDKALEIGFHKVGIVRAVLLEEEKSRLEEWLAVGYHAEMRWLEREPEKRADPTLYFPQAKSVIALALNYYTPHQHSEDETTGKISRYAWGDDYHDVLQEKLRALLAWIKAEIPNAEGKICADIQPVMDKAWAVRAGLGWIGKHTNLITRDFGSWVFLGEILLNLELDYDTQIEADHCGNCTACIDACPTAAITAPYVVDSRKCISYATIELRDSELPNEISEKLNGWLYGCDICQDVCPWNRFEKPTDEARFEPRPNLLAPNLQEIAEMPQEIYIEKFRKSAIKRTKLSGIQRNAKTLLTKKFKD